MTTLTLLSALLALGAHVVVPWRLASVVLERPRNRWRLAALPLLGTTVLAGLAWMAAHPDHLLGVSWGEAPLTRGAVTAAVFTLGALALLDVGLLLRWRRLEPAVWRLAGTFALLPLAAVSTLQEILRVGGGPRTTGGALVLAVAIHGLVSLAAGEAVAPRPAPVPRPRARAWRPPTWRPWLSLAAGLGLPLYPLALPPAVRARLLAGGESWTLAAAALLFLVAPWVPDRFRRGTLLAAALLAALVLARAVELASTFPVWMDPVIAL